MQLRRALLAGLGAGALALSGCVSTGTMTCPPDVTFSAESQKKLAAELRAAVPEAEWPAYITAYSRHRKTCRAIEKATR